MSNGVEMTPQSVTTQEVYVPGRQDRWGTYPTAGLTPAGLASIHKQADQGYVSRQTELWAEMLEKDSHLQSVVGKRSRRLTSRQREVVAASDDERDLEIAEFVRSCLNGIPFFPQRLAALWQGIPNGYAVGEVMWTFDESERKFRPTEIRSVPGTRFRVDVGDELLFLDGTGGGNETPLADFHPAKFLVVKHPGPSGTVCRPEVLRSVSWYYLFKRFSVVDWLTFAERFGQPFRYGTYPKGSSEADRDAASAGLAAIGSDAWALFPEAFKVEFIESMKSGGSNEVHAVLAKFCNAELSKSVVGQTLTTEQGERGARSLGEVHAGELDALVDGDAGVIEEVLQRGLIDWIVAFNYGDDVARPTLEIERSSSDDLTAEVERTKAMVAMGLPVSKRWAHERFGFPVPEDDDELLHAPVAVSAAMETGDADSDDVDDIEEDDA